MFDAVAGGVVAAVTVARWSGQALDPAITAIFLDAPAELPPRALRPVPGLNLPGEPGYLTSTTQSLDQGPPAVIVLGSRYGRGEGTSLMRV
jgi:hypothetical protein